MSRSIAIDSRTINRKTLASTAFNLAKNQNPQSRRLCGLCTTGKFAVSRVLYFRWCSGRRQAVLPRMEATIIFLGRPLLDGSSDQPERAPGKGYGGQAPRRSSLVLLRMGFTRNKVASVPRGLLHHGSTLACALTRAIGGPFLWHYPSARADWTLSSILPCGARTFLPRPKPPAIVCQTFRYVTSSIARMRGNDNGNRWNAQSAERRAHRSRNGSVEICEAIASVAYPCSRRRSCSQSARRFFMIFSALWPGSTMHSPAASASCAVW